MHRDSERLRMNPSKEDLELRRDFDGAEFGKTELFIFVWLPALFRASIGNKSCCWKGAKKKRVNEIQYIIFFF